MRRTRGRFFAIVGPDGAGKTTLAHAILDSANGPTTYVHFRPPILSRLPSLPGPVEVAQPDKRPRGTRVGGWLRILVSLIRFWIGYVITIRPILRQDGTVVADRWAYGYMAQPQALRFFGPSWLARSMVRIVPKPDLVVNLAAAPILIAARKPELTVDEVRSELASWARLPVRQLETLDASLSPEQLADLVQEKFNAKQAGAHSGRLAEYQSNPDD